jgi:membrane-associated phospholipid phosphatase
MNAVARDRLRLRAEEVLVADGSADGLVHLRVVIDEVGQAEFQAVIALVCAGPAETDMAGRHAGAPAEVVGIQLGRLPIRGRGTLLIPASTRSGYPFSADGGIRYGVLMLKASATRAPGRGTPVKVLGTLGAGGAATVLTSWAVGRLMQSSLVTRPSRQVYEYVRARRSEQVSRRLEQAVTTMGDYPVVVPFSVLVGGLIAYEQRDWVPMPLLIGGLAAEVSLQKLLKTLVKGSKPPPEHSVGPPGDFPSGGAARTVITFGLLAHLLAKRWDTPPERLALWSIAVALMAAQGGSRLYLGRHWPEDVLGGWLFGWLILRSLIKAAEFTGSGQLG